MLEALKTFTYQPQIEVCLTNDTGNMILHPFVHDNETFPMPLKLASNDLLLVFSSMLSMKDYMSNQRSMNICRDVFYNFQQLGIIQSIINKSRNILLLYFFCTFAFVSKNKDEILIILFNSHVKVKSIRKMFVEYNHTKSPYSYILPRIKEERMKTFSGEIDYLHSLGDTKMKHEAPTQK